MDKPARPTATAPAKRAPTSAWQVDLTGNWSDADSRRASKALAQKLAGSPWVRAFRKRRRRPPRLRLITVRNRTSQMLNTRHLRRELAKSLRAHRRALRLLPDEKKSKKSKKSKRRRPADLRLTLWLLGHRDARGGTTVTDTLLSLVGTLPSGEQVVAALHEQRKLVVRPPRKHKASRWRPKVSYLPLDRPFDLSGYLNGYDIRRLSRGALRSLLASPWLAKAPKAKSKVGARPVVRLAPLRNRTAEHLPLTMLRHRLAAGLLESGKARLLGTSSGGADAVITGHVASVVSRVDHGKTKQEVRLYMLALRATTSSGLVRWIHTGKVKKVVVLPPTAGGSHTRPSSRPIKSAASH